jgi:hypothetical protein
MASIDEYRITPRISSSIAHAAISHVVAEKRDEVAASHMQPLTSREGAPQVLPWRRKLKTITVGRFSGFIAVQRFENRRLDPAMTSGHSVSLP